MADMASWPGLRFFAPLFVVWVVTGALTVYGSLAFLNGAGETSDAIGIFAGMVATLILTAMVFRALFMAWRHRSQD